MPAALSYPPLTFDAKLMPQVVANIWHAQRAGWPKILTYVRSKDHHRLRYLAMNPPEGRVPAINGAHLHRDEYPFVCTKEHKGDCWIGHVLASENRAQGAQMSVFFRENGAYDGRVNHADGFKFEVVLANLSAIPGLE